MTFQYPVFERILLLLHCIYVLSLSCQPPKQKPNDQLARRRTRVQRRLLPAALNANIHHLALCILDAAYHCKRSVFVSPATDDCIIL